MGEEKANLPVWELFKSRIEAEFKKGKLQIATTSSIGNRLKQEGAKSNTTFKGCVIIVNIRYT